MRISATQIDAFVRWQKNEEAPLEEIVDYLLKKTAPTEPMRAGTAFHKVLETSTYGEIERAEQDGFTFDLGELDCSFELPQVRELKLECLTVIAGFPVTVVGVVDAQRGRGVYDHKLTSRFDAERYADSYQWRCYLHWFGYDWMQYNVFEAYQPATEPGLYEVRHFHPLKFTRYPEIGEDVDRVAREFVLFLREYVPELAIV
jgi:hypothetical protein